MANKDKGGSKSSKTAASKSLKEKRQAKKAKATRSGASSINKSLADPAATRGAVYRSGFRRPDDAGGLAGLHGSLTHRPSRAISTAEAVCLHP
jgi:hypothetical protein